MYLVLIQTSGNQSYIFGTNKLRENVGASQLTYECGTQWVVQAVDALAPSGKALWTDDDESRWTTLASQTLHPRIESGAAYEVVYATSGNALIFARDRSRAIDLVGAVTRKAAVDAPGLDVLGCIREVAWPCADIGSEIRSVYAGFEALRSWRSGPRRRAQSLPFVARCSRSGLPASGSRDDDLSIESLLKWDASDRWTKRQLRLFPDFVFPDDINALEAELSKEGRWVAVAHGDGNGLGDILQKFASTLPPGPDGIDPGRHYIDCLRDFSIDLERQAKAAFRDAAAAVSTSRTSGMTPIIPLVLGGDDLTVVCAGNEALAFALRYLAAFERLTHGLHGVDDHVRFLTGSVGVAIVKPHFPFHAAYHLAEQLLQSAKAVKRHSNGRPHSAVDFHVLYDSSFVGLESIRRRLVTNASPSASLTAKPYVTSQLLPGTVGWLDAHHVDGLTERVKALRMVNDEKEPLLSRAQLHELRAALFEGEDAAQGQLQLSRHRYNPQVLQALLESNDQFFRPGLKAGTRETRLVDALEVVDGFWPL